MSSPVAWQCCEPLWFDDGNIILEAGGTIFRVFRGMLSRNSTVFADMLSVPQGDSGGMETFEGLPLVHMPDDKLDLEYFLRAVHDPSYYRQDIPTDFRVIEGILRLASKYNLPYLRKRCITDLTHHFPDTLEKYLADDPSDPPRISTLTLLGVVSLAREVNALVILPVALYDVTVYCDLSDIWDGKTYPNGRHIMLNEIDKRASFMAAIWVHDLVREQLAPLLSPGMREWNSCTMPDKCMDERSHMCTIDRIAELGRDIFVDDVLCLDMCPGCNLRWEEEVQSIRKRVWEELPGQFGLPSWAELRAATQESSMDED